MNKAIIAAYENVIALCEADSGEFHHDDLTEAENVLMWEKLDEIAEEFRERIKKLKA